MKYEINKDDVDESLPACPDDDSDYDGMEIYVVGVVVSNCWKVERLDSD